MFFYVILKFTCIFTLTASNEVIASFPGNDLNAAIDFDSNLLTTGSLSIPLAILYNHNLKNYKQNYTKNY